MSYPKKEIGKFVVLKQGFAINKNTKHHMSEIPTDLHLLRIGDMKDNIFNTFVKDTIPKSFLASKDDIIYTRTGQVGLVFTNQTGVVHNNCFTVTPIDENILSRKYLFYALQEKSFYAEANARSAGAAQPDLPHEAFKSISLYMPPLATQKKIADILSAYDDLIENNQKQINLLEEATQRLYKEWFVDLHFPNYENTEIIDGIPSGWEEKSILECLELYIGGGWGKETPTGKSTIKGSVIRGTDINDIKLGSLQSLPLRYHTENDISKRALKKGDIVFEISNGNINNIGRSLLIDDLLLKECGENTICASFCKLLRPLDEYFSIIVYSEIQYMQSSGKMMPFKKQGSNGINNFAFEDFLEYNLLVPNDMKIINPIKNIFESISIYQYKLSLLKEARDRLLPKLMSGEIEV